MFLAYDNCAFIFITFYCNPACLLHSINQYIYILLSKALSYSSPSDVFSDLACRFVTCPKANGLAESLYIGISSHVGYYVIIWNQSDSQA